MELVISITEGADVHQIEKQFGLKLEKNSPRSTVIFTAQIDEEAAAKTMSALEASPLIEAVEKNTHSFGIL